MSADSNIDTIRQEYRFLAELVKRSGKDLLDRSVVVSGENFDASLSRLAADAGRAANEIEAEISTRVYHYEDRIAQLEAALMGWLRAWDAASTADEEGLTWIESPDEMRALWQVVDNAAGTARHLIGADAGEADREPPRCTGYCVFDGDVLGPEDIACPIHGIEARKQAEKNWPSPREWMKACRASFPYAPLPDDRVAG